MVALIRGGCIRRVTYPEHKTMKIATTILLLTSLPVLAQVNTTANARDPAHPAARSIIGVLTSLLLTDDSGSGTIDPATRIAAARQTAMGNAKCAAVAPFYYELGDQNGVILGDSVGGTDYTASTKMSIASASKWLFGAYVAETQQGIIDLPALRATRMLAGYASMADTCSGIGATVASCFASNGNDTYTAAKLDRFNYNSGHFQKWGVDNGMANMTATDVAQAYQATLGIPVLFSGPLLAGGAIMSAQDYAQFLRKMLSGQLRIAALLGSDPTCTQPSSCPTADASPLTNEAWHYSLGHWVEDDPAVGDGSFSSAGAFGFYPWIDRTKTYYGILARSDKSGDNQGYASAQCGRLIRKAYLTGSPQ